MSTEEADSRQGDESIEDTSIDIRIDLSDLDEIDTNMPARNNEQNIERTPARDVVGPFQPRPFEPWDETAKHNHSMLRRAVTAFWIDGALKSSLHREMLIRFNLVQRRSAIPFPLWNMSCQQPDQPVRAVAGERALLNLFTESEQAMLIVGEAGAGKTITLLHVADALIAQVEEDPQPTPVVFNLSYWDKESDSFEKWLEEELVVRYHMPREVSRNWVRNDELLLLLDGLDEVAADRREACVRAINAFRQAHPAVGMIICCRTGGFEALTDQLDIPTVVTIEPFTAEQIANYMGGARADRLMLPDALISDPEMQTLAQTPLLLTILTLTYSRQPEGAVRQRRAGRTAREHLFDQFIRYMFQQVPRPAYGQFRGISPNIHTKESSLRWLRWLAKKMTVSDQSVFQLEDLQRTRFLSQFTAVLHLPLTLLLSALYLGVLSGLFTLVGFRPLAGLIFGLIFGFVLRTESTIKEQQSPYSYIHTLTTSIRSDILRGLLFAGFFVTLFFGWLPFVLFCAFMIAIFMVLYQLFGDIGPTHARVYANPNQGTRQSLHTALMAGAAIWLVVSPFLALIVGVLRGGVLGLFFGLTGALLVGFYSAIEHMAARILLTLAGKIPAAYARFLDISDSRLFLRKVGSSYIFSHRLLRDHIANLTTEDIEWITQDVVAKVEDIDSN